MSTKTHRRHVHAKKGGITNVKRELASHDESIRRIGKTDRRLVNAKDGIDCVKYKIAQGTVKKVEPQLKRTLLPLPPSGY
jgi:hypothetical protein